MHHLLLLVIACSGVSSLGPVKYFDAVDMTKAKFESLLLNGEVAIIRNASSFWPIANWTCEQFRTNPDMRGFKVERVYGSNDGTFVPLCSTVDEWEKDARPSLNDDHDGPSLAPLYWDVKGDDASKEVIDRLTPAWPFLSKPNYYWKKNAVELWFSPPNSGAKYHVDGHVQMTVVSQLVGSRRWRLALLPEERRVNLIPNHLDSDSFAWTPEISIVLKSGDLLMFPPGSIHDTLNLDETNCAVSVTHQLGVPYPIKFYRKHMRRIAHLSDTREIWPVIADIASFGFLRPRMTVEAPYFETHESIKSLFPATVQYPESNPVQFFSHVYEHFVNRPDPLVGHFGQRRPSEYIAYHDTNGDGLISLSEFIEAVVEWHSVEMGILDGIPKKFRPLRYFYTELESRISPSYMAELSDWSRNEL